MTATLTTSASRRPVLLSLSTALYGFVLLWGLLFVVVTWLLISDRVATAQQSGMQQAVAVRGAHAARDFAKVLEQDWRDLKMIGERLALEDPDALRGALDLTVGDGSRVSWAGLASAAGTVVASSGGLLDGADVSSRPWFQRGLSGDFAGDVHDAKLLNKLLGGTEAEPLRFIDLAARVSHRDDSVDGVLGFHINFAWAQTFLAETADSLDIDLFLVSQNGEVIIATDGSPDVRGDLPSLRAASAGVSYEGQEVWPDGQTYFTSVIPTVMYGELPSFGWRMVARISSESFTSASSELLGALSSVIALTGLGLLIMTIIFVRLFIKPLQLLAENAHRIANGENDYPLEINQTSELATLSSALVRLQGRRRD